jgi:hypothetical protein
MISNGLAGEGVSRISCSTENEKNIITNFLNKPIQIRSAGIGVPGIYSSPGRERYGLQIFRDGRIIILKGI